MAIYILKSLFLICFFMNSSLAKNISFNVEEGTWIDLDVSPNGKNIIFSLLGHLYIMPIKGGESQSITSGSSWNVQPRFSPDGKEIVFTSDRGGGNNLWRFNLDSGKFTQVTNEDFVFLIIPFGHQMANILLDVSILLRQGHWELVSYG